MAESHSSAKTINTLKARQYMGLRKARSSDTVITGLGGPAGIAIVSMLSNNPIMGPFWAIMYEMTFI